MFMRKTKAWEPPPGTPTATRIFSGVSDKDKAMFSCLVKETRKRSWITIYLCFSHWVSWVGGCCVPSWSKKKIHKKGKWKSPGCCCSVTAIHPLGQCCATAPPWKGWISLCLPWMFLVLSLRWRPHGGGHIVVAVVPLLCYTHTWAMGCHMQLIQHTVECWPSSECSTRPWKGQTSHACILPTVSSFHHTVVWEQPHQWVQFMTQYYVSFIMFQFLEPNTLASIKY